MTSPPRPDLLTSSALAGTAQHSPSRQPIQHQTQHHYASPAHDTSIRTNERRQLGELVLKVSRLSEVLREQVGRMGTLNSVVQNIQSDTKRDIQRLNDMGARLREVEGRMRSRSPIRGRGPSQLSSALSPDGLGHGSPRDKADLSALEIQCRAIEASLVQSIVTSRAEVQSAAEEVFGKTRELTLRDACKEAGVDPSLLTEEERETRQIVKLQSLVRSWLLRRKFRKIAEDYLYSPLSAKLRQRNSVIREIVHSERSYVHFISHIVDKYLHPLREKSRLNANILKRDEIFDIFWNIESILNVHKIFLRDVEKAYDEWPMVKMGKPFHDMEKFSQLYADYVNNFSSSLSALCRARENVLFQQFLEKAEGEFQPNEDVPATSARDLDLSSLLVMPIQRIPRYVLLLSELVKCTPEDHTDFTDLTQALSRIQGVAEQINEQKRQRENLENILYVQNNLVGDYQCLLTGNREYVKGGPIVKVSKRNRNVQRQLFLFTDVLLVCATAWNQFKFQGFRLKSAVQTQMLQLEEVQHFSSGQNLEFAFKLRTPERDYVFCASTATEKDSWVKSFLAVLTGTTDTSTITIRRTKSITLSGEVSEVLSGDVQRPQTPESPAPPSNGSFDTLGHGQDGGGGGFTENRDFAGASPQTERRKSSLVRLFSKKDKDMDLSQMSSSPSSPRSRSKSEFASPTRRKSRMSMIFRSSPTASSTPAVLKIYLMDLSYKTLPIGEALMTVTDVLQQLSEKLEIQIFNNPPSVPLYNLYEMSENKVVGSPLVGMEDIVHIRNEWNKRSKTKGSNFLLRRCFLLHDMALPTQHPQELNLLFMQAAFDVVHSRYPCPLEAAIKLAALQLQASFGDYTPEEHGRGFLTSRVSEFVPSEISERGEAHVWEEVILKEYDSLRGTFPLDAKIGYLESVRQQQLYGSHMYDAKMCTPESTDKLPKSSQFSNVIICINSKGVHFVSPKTSTQPQTLLHSLTFREIRRWDVIEEEIDHEKIMLLVHKRFVSSSENGSASEVEMESTYLRGKAVETIKADMWTFVKLILEAQKANQ